MAQKHGTQVINQHPIVIIMVKHCKDCKKLVPSRRAVLHYGLVFKRTVFVEAEAEGTHMCADSPGIYISERNAW